EVPAPLTGRPPAGPVGDGRVPTRPPRLLRGAERPRRDVLPLLRGRGLLRPGAGRRVVGVVRAVAAGDAPLPAAHPGGAAAAAARHPARAADVLAEALAALAGEAA